ncbi:glycoside hydrolase family 43 protein [Aestuariibaculum suncheonense]|uniref:Glycoside hydrolase family 43 protein n=1 Tax=Aestuariibaculum suncheonense TaxID=1028745 RepID=A0A8J6UA55_9FLAO|nr:glycoside hydrolase family 43 protein [Aestuariibaculum suncheonense]MBD0834838.1 glycoside hydrolase family 43 protein [Aestuariibaculum suncheonense]
MGKHIFGLIIILGSFYSCKFVNGEAPKDKDLSPYLMVYFKDDDHSLHMALSTDGYSFTDVNQGKAIVAGDTIASQKGIRDPHISRGPDGSFYVVMTDLHIFAKEQGYRETQWERPGEKYDWGNNRGFVLMKSYDLIHWTHSNFLFDQAFEGYENIGCAWAPQSIYDSKEKKMMVYFTMRMYHGLTKMYYAYANEDFTALISEPKLLFEYPDENIQLLDADITLMPDGRFCLTYVAQEHPIGIKMAFSDHINAGYEYQDAWIDQEPGSCEAPNVWKRNGSDTWVLMYDIYSINPHNFGFIETTDFKMFKDLGHFNEGVMKTTNFASPKHGAIISITKDEALRLAKHWGMSLSL